MDSDKLLICEAYSVAQNTATILKDPGMKSSKVDEVINKLSEDRFNNNVGEFDRH